MEVLFDLWKKKIHAECAIQNDAAEQEAKKTLWIHCATQLKNCHLIKDQPLVIAILHALCHKLESGKVRLPLKVFSGFLLPNC